MVREVDLRCDTVIKPTPAMRKAMAEAVVGDDVFKEDPTLNELEEKVAKLFGKEAALFVPSGTMGNLVSVMAHCWTRGQEIIIGDQSHMYKERGISELTDVHVRTIPNQEDGTFSMEDLLEKLRPEHPDCPEPKIGLICIENSNSKCGGKVLPMSFIREVCDVAENHGIPVHMDGARIINASVSSGVPVNEIIKDCASVSMCLSKGVGGLVGSVVAGNKELIAKVHRCRNVLGGAMTQAGVFAAAAIVALETAADRIRVDHERAKKLAQDICNLKSKLVTVDPQAIHSNILLLNFPSPSFTSQNFFERMAEVKDEDEKKVIVKARTWCKNRVRVVLHSDLSQDDLDCTFRKIHRITL